MKGTLWLIIALMLGAIVPATTWAQIVTKPEWEENASNILNAYKRNRSEQEFAKQFFLYNTTLFLAYDDISENRPNRVIEIRLALMMYLNAKLYCQYVLDHPVELKDKTDPAKEALKIYGDIFRQYRVTITEIDLNDFRFSFVGHPKFRLRSL